MIENRRQRTRSHGTLNGAHDPLCNPLFLRILERLAKLTEHKRSTQPDQRRKLLKSMERETGIEPATNSLEGCDSTIELLPLVFVFSNFHCGLLRSFAANGAQWRQFAQSLHKAGAPLHKCTKSPPGPRYASCREPPS